MAQKFGYDNVEDFKENAQKTFSLAETGVLEQESTRLLLVNVSLHLCPDKASSQFLSCP